MISTDKKIRPIKLISDTFFEFYTFQYSFPLEEVINSKSKIQFYNNRLS